jgi:hypothetical protein
VSGPDVPIKLAAHTLLTTLDVVAPMMVIMSSNTGVFKEGTIFAIVFLTFFLGKFNTFLMKLEAVSNS